MDTENIKVTNGEAIALLSNRIWGLRSLPVKTRYWLSRIADKLNSVAKAVSTERDKIINDFCDKDADGKPVIKGNKYSFNDPAREFEANKVIAELMKIENELPWPRMIINLTEVPEGFDMSAADMADAQAVAEFVFEEPQPKENS